MILQPKYTIETTLRRSDQNQIPAPANDGMQKYQHPPFDREFSLKTIDPTPLNADNLVPLPSQPVGDIMLNMGIVIFEDDSFADFLGVTWQSVGGYPFLVIPPDSIDEFNSWGTVVGYQCSYLERVI